MPEFGQIVEGYKERLGLLWETEVVVTDIDLPRIVSSKPDRKHLILIPTDFDSTKARQVLFHELVHAEMAEKLDPIFAAVFRHSRHEGDPRAPEYDQWLDILGGMIEVWNMERMDAVDLIAKLLMIILPMRLPH